MGKILPSYKKAMIDEILDNINSNTSSYYIFASEPTTFVTTPEVTDDDYSKIFKFDWSMLFGKKLTFGDISPMIEKNMWTSGASYDRYDNTSNTIFANNNFYVITNPTVVGGDYYVYKCIDNANGIASTINPSSIATPKQPNTFRTSDGYKWRYVASISSKNYDKFASDGFVPVKTDTVLATTSDTYSGVDLVVITNSGSGYSTYHSGNVRAVINSTVIQIESSASNLNDFYTNNGIYIYNTLTSTSQLFGVKSYVISGSTKLITLTEEANTAAIATGVTQYYISPRVVFHTDGDINPAAYSVINTTSNSISEIVILESGSNISWANVSIQSNSTFGSGANVYAIVPPPGGHGFDAPTELNVKGIGFSATFANTEGGLIDANNISYSKIGIMKNPYAVTANNAKGANFYSNTFNQIMKATVSPDYLFQRGDLVYGTNSDSLGIVVFSNTSAVYLAGDKTFANNEGLALTRFGQPVTTINISAVPQLYTKDITPLYVQNINTVNRSNTQSESFKLILEI